MKTLLTTVALITLIALLATGVYWAYEFLHVLGRMS